MKSLSELEKEVLGLPHAERERLALRVWESLEQDAEQGVSDPEGLALARQRDREIESGEKKVLTEEEFRRMTGGSSEGETR